MNRVYIKVHSVCFIVQWILTNAFHISTIAVITWHSFITLKISCAFSIQSFFFFPGAWKTTVILMVSLSLPFLEYHTIGIIEYLLEWLFSLSNMQLSLFHGISWLDSFFLFITELYFIVWVYQSQFTHAPMKDILVAPSLGTIMIGVPINIRVEVFVVT